MDLPAAFARLRSAFPQVAEFQGVHFKFALLNGVFLIEKKRHDHEGNPHFYYWLIWEGDHKLVHASKVSKIRPMKTIGESFSLAQ